MFGLTNKTFTFLGRIGTFTFEFTAGVLEEVTLNVTGSAAANAAELPQNIDVNFISKDQLITTTSAVVSSKIAQTKLIDVVAGATTNLLI